MNGIDQGLNGKNEGAIDSAALFPVAMLLAITILQSEGFYPQLSLIADWLPATCACLYGAAFLPLVFAASRHATFLEGKVFRPSMLVLSVVGAFLCWHGIFQSNALVTLVAYICLALPRAFANCLALVRLARNQSASTFMTVAVAMTGAYTFVALSGPAAAGNPALYLILTILALATTYALLPLSGDTQSVAPLELATVNPDAFPESKGKLMGVIAVFEGIFGLSSTVAGDAPASSVSALCSLGVVGILWLVARNGRDHVFDRMFSLAASLTVTSLTLVLAGVGAQFGLPQIIGTVATQVFYIEIWTMLSAIAARNPIGDMLAVAKGLALSSIAAGLGVCLAWLESENPHFSLVAQVGSSIAFFLYLWFAMRDFSFDERITLIPPVPATVEGPQDSGVAFEEVCTALALSCGLTQRESEVFALLAHGRNAASIMERLSISRSTTKTHVRHIYQKMRIHTQQELIDLVEKEVKSS